MDPNLPNASPQLPEKEMVKTSSEKIVEPFSKTNASFSFNKLTKEDKDKLMIEKNRIPFGILILKLVALLLLFLVSVSFIWFSLDLDRQNTVLSTFGKPENTEIKFKRLKKQKQLLEDEKQKNESKIRQFETRIKNKSYFVYTEIINEIKDGQYQWFDEINDDGEIQKYGILNGVENMKDYFNSRNYKHPVLMSGNNIEIDSSTTSREKISFNVTGTNLFGKVFFLNAEFIEMLNSFPLYKNGEIRNFLRKKMDDGNDGMTFSLKLDIQQEDEEDPADIRFSEYENWHKNLSKIKDTPKIKK
jgi:hypothetical protein